MEYVIQLDQPTDGGPTDAEEAVGLYVIHYSEALMVPVLSRQRHQAKRFPSPEAARAYWQTMETLRDHFTVKIKLLVPTSTESPSEDPQRMGLDR